MTDSCPSCCRRGIPPAAEVRRGHRIVHGYICATCDWRWATTRLIAAYPARPDHAQETAA